jgi:erythromycin esterase-like protein
MMETVNELLRFLSIQQDTEAKLVLWAHNSHLGDARYTYMSTIGEHNVGQLAREQYGDEALNIGFTTYTGTVTAADDWNAPAQRKRVRPGRDDSYEGLLHQAEQESFWLDFDETEIARVLEPERLERAIGVIYRPQTERLSHYFEASLSHQFDRLIHIDHTNALDPLERTPEWERGEDTYPTGL